MEVALPTLVPHLASTYFHYVFKKNVRSVALLNGVVSLLSKKVHTETPEIGTTFMVEERYQITSIASSWRISGSLLRSGHSS